MSMRVSIASVLAAMAVVGTSVSAGQFVEIESGSSAEPVRLIGYLAQPRERDPFRPSSCCMDAAAFTAR